VRAAFATAEALRAAFFSAKSVSGGLVRRASNGVNEQHERGPGDPYQRDGRSSGQKAVGPVLSVAKHFRPIDHCYLHNNVVQEPSRLGVAPPALREMCRDLRYGIIAAAVKGTTIVALLCSEPDREHGKAREHDAHPWLTENAFDWTTHPPHAC